MYTQVEDTYGARPATTCAHGLLAPCGAGSGYAADMSLSPRRGGVITATAVSCVWYSLSTSPRCGARRVAVVELPCCACVYSIGLGCGYTTAHVHSGPRAGPGATPAMWYSLREVVVTSLGR